MIIWIRFAYALLQFANHIFSTIDRETLIKLGEDRQGAKALLALNENARKLAEINAHFDGMTDAEISDEITKQGDWRD